MDEERTEYTITEDPERAGRRNAKRVRMDAMGRIVLGMSVAEAKKRIDPETRELSALGYAMALINLHAWTVEELRVVAVATPEEKEELCRAMSEARREYENAIITPRLAALMERDGIIPPRGEQDGA